MRLYAVKEFPIQKPIWLVFQIEVGVQTSVDENMRIRLKVSGRAFEKLPVRIRYQRSPVLTIVRPIGKQGVQTAVTLPQIFLQGIFTRIKNHHLVVPTNKNGRA